MTRIHKKMTEVEERSGRGGDVLGKVSVTMRYVHVLPHLFYFLPLLPPDYLLYD